MSEGNTDTGDTSSPPKAEEIAADAGGSLQPREALITTAMNFLQNPKIRHSSIIKKQQFLQSKGLSAQEIQIACERVGIFSQDPNSTIINMGINTSQMPQMLTTRSLQTQQVSRLTRIKEILHSMALVSGLGYAIYLLYKNYIEPFLFGRKKKKTIDESLQDIDQKVDTRISDVNRELFTIKETLTLSSQQQNQLMSAEFSHFKADLEAIKGLLLNRKQFANPLTAVPPSIPAWQLSSAPHRRNSHSDDNEKNDDAGSGSGSSETEVVTKNSDSSLEIM